MAEPVNPNQPPTQHFTPHPDAIKRTQDTKDHDHRGQALEVLKLATDFLKNGPHTADDIVAAADKMTAWLKSQKSP